MLPDLRRPAENHYHPHNSSLGKALKSQACGGRTKLRTKADTSTLKGRPYVPLLIVTIWHCPL